MGNESFSVVERVLIAFVMGAIGFVTGILAVWTLTSLPGLKIGGGVYLSVGTISGLVCLVFGYQNWEKTTDGIVNVWGALWKLSLGLIRHIRYLAK